MLCNETCFTLKRLHWPSQFYVRLSSIVHSSTYFVLLLLNVDTVVVSVLKFTKLSSHCTVRKWNAFRYKKIKLDLLRTIKLQLFVRKIIPYGNPYCAQVSYTYRCHYLLLCYSVWALFRTDTVVVAFQRHFTDILSFALTLTVQHIYCYKVVGRASCPWFSINFL